MSQAMQAFRTFLGESDMLAYLAMMAPRLVELRRVLKPTGSLYLHCDPTASHYLKLLLDAVFGPVNFRTVIVWKRSSAHSDAKQGRTQHGRIHDVILFYTKTDAWGWNHVFTPYDPSYTDAFYKHVEPETGRPSRNTSCAPGFPWTLDCERVLAGGVSKWGSQIEVRRRRREPGGRPEMLPGTGDIGKCCV